MPSSRRAAIPGASPSLIATVRVALAVVSTALTITLSTLAFVSIRVARKVVTPAVRLSDTRILSLDTTAQTITLGRTPDTELPGRYGMFTTGTEDYVKLGSVLAEDDTSVTRKLLTQIGPDSRLSAEATFSGWYFDRAEELHLPFTSELIDSSVGLCPAWLFPAGEGDTWVIQVHGRGASRAECLRAVPIFHNLGITSLVVSYRNDAEAPPSKNGTYTLGATEWRDVDAAVAFAVTRGAQRVILMGWSMGGAIALQLALNSAHREVLSGVILESPVVDWRVVLDYQAKMLRLPTAVAGLAIGALQTPWATPVTGAEEAIRFDRLDALARADELRHPILILHSDDDGFVPSDASHDLLVARPDLVELEVFEVARHTKLWNYDQDRWSKSITSWLDRLHLSSTTSTD